MLESYKWMGWVWDGMGMGWKSLRGVILRAPLCGANKDPAYHISLKLYLQQGLLRIPGGRGPVQEEEEVEGPHHHHQSDLEWRPPTFEKKNLSTVAAVCRERRKQIFGDRVDLSSLQSCQFINY